ncbi:transporter substrate-binding domain-containing protein [Rugamonas sp. FT29W]|uniref:Transporter substrate-binding domain-containing protein n=1 Tax=Rugamonas aquatica TaxID=2743357 RepID=A0A6A7N5K8_9BURK|nr:transporter substrate-binding domain-containing protein [Rugamonas aquatica]
MRGCKFLVGVFSLFTAAMLSAHAVQPVRFLMLENRTMPFGLVERGPNARLILAAGITKDWQDALAKELGRTPAYVLLPRKRQDMAVAQKLVDLRCFISPDWLTSEQVEQYDWPAPFFDVEERLIGPLNGKPVESIDELSGARIGTVLGYSYRSLDPLFADGRAKRDDASNEMSSLLKQVAGRTDFMVMRTLDFEYQQKTDPTLKGLRLTPVVVSRFSMYCARPKYSSVTLRDLSNAQTRLLNTGVLSGILAKYR